MSGSATAVPLKQGGGKYVHVCRHLRLWAHVGADMGMEVCIGTCVRTSIEYACAQTSGIHMCTDLCTNAYTETSTTMYSDSCIDTCVDRCMHTDQLTRCSRRRFPPKEWPRPAPRSLVLHSYMLTCLHSYMVTWSQGPRRGLWCYIVTWRQLLASRTTPGVTNHGFLLSTCSSPANHGKGPANHVHFPLVQPADHGHLPS